MTVTSFARECKFLSLRLTLTSTFISQNDFSQEDKLIY